MKKIWICPSSFEFDAYVETSTASNKNVVNRAEEIWNQAKVCLERKNFTEFDRSDAISWLKRALNQRLQLIESIYSLRQFALPESPKGYLEYLASLNIVRPTMLKTLMTIRNDIEHNDAPPPPLERCLELLDLMWYFIRSTDELVKNQKGSVIFQENIYEYDESPYWVSLNINFDKPFSAEGRGWVKSNKLSHEIKKGWIEVSVDEISCRSEKLPNTKDHIDKSPDDVFFNGYFILKQEQAFSLLAKALKAN